MTGFTVVKIVKELTWSVYLHQDILTTNVKIIYRTIVVSFGSSF